MKTQAEPTFETTGVGFQPIIKIGSQTPHAVIKYKDARDLTILSWISINKRGIIKKSLIFYYITKDLAPRVLSMVGKSVQLPYSYLKDILTWFKQQRDNHSFKLMLSINFS